MIATGNGVTMPQIRIDNLTLDERREFVVKPLEQYMLDAGSPIIRTVNNVTGEGWDMDLISGTDVVVQPGYSDDFEPMGEVNITGKRLTVNPFKVNVEWSRSELYGTILERLGGNELDRANLNNSPAGRIILETVVGELVKDMNRNIFDVALFGDKNMNLSTLSCVPTNTRVSAALMKSRAFNMLTNTNGLFAQLSANAGCLVGQLSHNESALADGYAITAFELVRDKANRYLEYAAEQEIAIVCSGSIYRNYQRHLQSLGETANGYEILASGARVMIWEGIRIYPITSFHSIDKKYFNKSNRHFAGLTTLKNICFGTDILAADAKPMFKVGSYAEPNEEKTYGKARFKMGIDIAFPEQINFATSWLSAN